MGDTRVPAIRGHATFLFADLCDYTALNELTDPEEVALVLMRVRDEVERVVRRHGGVANEWRGDGVLCIFGMPQSTEQDARHAIEAALAMHACVRELDGQLELPVGFQLRLHSGIDSGLVFARKRQGSDGYDLIGDAVNTAARLCARAQRDEIWASDVTLGVLKELFETDRREALVLKGKQARVSACRILGRSQASTRFAAAQRRGLTPLVGREQSLAKLKLCLDRALHAQSELVSVIGSAGVGKSRLLEEFRRKVAETVPVYVGGCENEPNATPLQPFIEILRQLLRVQARSSSAEAIEAVAAGLRRIAPVLQEHQRTVCHLLGLRLFSSDHNPTFVQQALIDAISQVCAAASSQTAMALVIDDWQWADDASRQVLGNLIRLLRHAPVLLVVASRDLADPLLAGHAALELQPFTLEQSAQVIAALLPYSLDLGLSRSIHERSGGSPLFLEELCRALPAEVPSGEEDLLASKVPGTLRGIVQVRVERLCEAAAQVLHAAAVIGKDVPRWLLEAVSNVADAHGMLGVLAESDLIHPVAGEAALRFKHGTTRDIVYDLVRLPERRRLHLAVAKALEAAAAQAGLPEPHEALAYHFFGAGDHERAARSAELAGDKAVAASSLDRARQQYRAALVSLRKLGLDGERERRWIGIVGKWSEASLYSPATEHLELIAESGERAARLGDWVAAARAENWLGWFCYALGDQEPAIAHWRAALGQAEALNDARLVGQILLNLGQSFAAKGAYGRALEHFAAGIAAKRRGSRGAVVKPPSERRLPLGYAYALACKSLLHGDVGEFGQAYEYLNEALGLLGGTGHAVEGSCLGMLEMVQLLQGRWAEALATTARTQATAERVNGPYVFAMSKTVSGYARWMLERSSRALSDMLHAVKWLEGRGNGLYVSFNYAYLADALAGSGDVEGARQYAHCALARADAGDPLGEGLACRTLACLAVQAGATGSEAAAYVERAFRSAHSRNSARELALTRLAAWKLDIREASNRASPPVLVQSFRTMGMNHHEHEAARLVT